MKIPMSADEQCRRKRSKSSFSPKKERLELCTLRTRLKTSRKIGCDDEFLCLSHADPGCRCLFVLIHHSIVDTSKICRKFHQIIFEFFKSHYSNRETRAKLMFSRVDVKISKDTE